MSLLRAKHHHKGAGLARSGLVAMALLGAMLAGLASSAPGELGRTAQPIWLRRPTAVDYAPATMPDFDQRQATWTNPAGQRTHDGPVAAANALWFVDSLYEPGSVAPPAESDGFGLVRAFGRWDDHDARNVDQPGTAGPTGELVDRLADYMNTNARRAQGAWLGTLPGDLDRGIKAWFEHTDTSAWLSSELVMAPEWRHLVERFRTGDNAILRLALREWVQGSVCGWCPLGAHYVTLAALDPAGRIALSDPLTDTMSTCPGVPCQPTRHNDAAVVSHDEYAILGMAGRIADGPETAGPFAAEERSAWGLAGYADQLGPELPRLVAVNRSAAGEAPPLGYTGGPISTTVEHAVVLSALNPSWLSDGHADYAPRGLPDFSQCHSGWSLPGTGVGPGQWTHAAPTALAGVLWWLDSRAEPNPRPPSTVNDGYALVTSYPRWEGRLDDHDAANVALLVEDLAWRMDTNGARSVHPSRGTRWEDVQPALESYLRARPAVSRDIELESVLAPSLDWLAQQVELGAGVLLWLGVWEEQAAGLKRVGGHVAAAAGVEPRREWLALADPIQDRAVEGGAGRVTHALDELHTCREAPLGHDDADVVSHDWYALSQPASPLANGSLELGGYFGPHDYGEAAAFAEVNPIDALAAHASTWQGGRVIMALDAALSLRHITALTATPSPTPSLSATLRPPTGTPSLSHTVTPTPGPGQATRTPELGTPTATVALTRDYLVKLPLALSRWRY